MSSTSSQNRTRKLVVAGLIVKANRVLITQRRADQALGLQWELPGGKLEPGESPTVALVRELREELGVTVTVGRIWELLYHQYEDFDLLMPVYKCSLEPGQVPACVEVADMAWCEPSELLGYDILPADQPLVDRLIDEGVPGSLT